MRIGELLSPWEDKLDPTATLTWACVKLRPDNSFLLHIKMPKMGTVEGEFVDIFPFPNLQLCPVSALRRHLSLQAKLHRQSPALRSGLQLPLWQTSHTSSLQLIPPLPAVGHL